MYTKYIKEGIDKRAVRVYRVKNILQCSKSCGGGIKERRVDCIIRWLNGDMKEQKVNDEECTRFGFNKPKTQRPCQRIPCDFTWKEGSWSEVVLTAP